MRRVTWMFWGLASAMSLSAVSCGEVDYKEERVEVFDWEAQVTVVDGQASALVALSFETAGGECRAEGELAGVLTQGECEGCTLAYLGNFVGFTRLSDESSCADGDLVFGALTFKGYAFSHRSGALSDDGVDVGVLMEQNDLGGSWTAFDSGVSVFSEFEEAPSDTAAGLNGVWRFGAQRSSLY